MKPVMLGVADAARAIGIGRTKLYELVNEGVLTAVKVGRRTLITMASLEALASAEEDR